MFFRLAALSRLVVTGKDRAKYLHNFCTNNIKELKPGNLCEAFFCDVKARIIAHGFILAFDDCHEIWMLAGDQTGLMKHLNRYIITEDVAVHSVTESTSAFGAIGASASKQLLSKITTADSANPAPMNCVRLPPADADSENTSTIAITVEWAETPILWVATQRILVPGILPPDVAANESQFEQLRIRERFPIINQDMSIDNIAPEADRNLTAISYVKGCYLGQEPIARLDAMGHVNRSLRCVESTASAEQLLRANVLTIDESIVGSVTSASSTQQGSIGLAMIRTNASERPLHCSIEDQTIDVRVDFCRK